MSVKIIRSHEVVSYSVEPRKVRIEFKDGSFMIGFINIHAKYSNDGQEDSSNLNLSVDDSKFKFHRTSDYLRHCYEHEGMITVYDGFYGGHQDRICFVFLHSVKFITEEQVVKKEQIPEPQQEEEVQPEKIGLSLRERLKRPE